MVPVWMFYSGLDFSFVYGCVDDLYGSDVDVVAAVASVGGSACAHSSNSPQEPNNLNVRRARRLRRLWAADFVSDVQRHVDFALAQSFVDSVYRPDANRLLQVSRRETLLDQL